jgi:hypothetical protein
MTGGTSPLPCLIMPIPSIATTVLSAGWRRQLHARGIAIHAAARANRVNFHLMRTSKERKMGQNDLIKSSD